MSKQQHTQEPVGHQFQDRDGEWHTFINQHHYENTVKDGSWPIRALYAFPPDAAARIAELERTLRQQAEAVTATINRHHQQMAELEKQRDELLSALKSLAWLQVGDQLGSSDVEAIRSVIADSEKGAAA